MLMSLPVVVVDVDVGIVAAHTQLVCVVSAFFLVLRARFHRLKTTIDSTFDQFLSPNQN